MVGSDPHQVAVARDWANRRGVPQILQDIGVRRSSIGSGVGVSVSSNGGVAAFSGSVSGAPVTGGGGDSRNGLGTAASNGQQNQGFWVRLYEYFWIP